MNKRLETGPPNDSMLFHQLRSLLDWNCGWYQKWYFMLRLEEELLRCRQHGHSCAVVVLTMLEIPCERAERNKFYEILAELTFSGFRLTDIPGVLSTSEYALLLPLTDAEGARAVAARLKQRLAAFSPVEGYAVFPDVTASAEKLVEMAIAMGWRDQEAFKCIRGDALVNPPPA
jgi:GGDEF domain-containing protein